METEKFNSYVNILKTHLSAARINHSVLVSKEAVRLAKIHGIDAKKAETAGMLHDIMKDSSKEVLLQTMTGFGIILSKVEQNAPKLWHAIAGEIVVKNEVKIKDQDILNAIRYHTTARKGMSDLEKIIYLADFISEDRDYEGLEQIKAAINIGIAEGMKEALIFSINDLVSKSVPIHPDTVEAYNEFMLLK